VACFCKLPPDSADSLGKAAGCLTFGANLVFRAVKSVSMGVKQPEHEADHSLLLLQRLRMCGAQPSCLTIST
jgi:hypothetical protein